MNAHLDTKKQQKLAKLFHSLHHENTLVVPNVWDAASAMLFEKSGFPALATTSSGMAWALGYKDGEHTPPELVIESLARICRVINVPLTADIEGGYYRYDFDKLRQFFEAVIDAGVVGMNLEDWDSQKKIMNDTDYHCEIIRLAKETAERKGIAVFVNARTDAYEKADGDKEERIAECIRRAKAFEDAGADGIFVPFVMELETVARLREEIKLPLNILINQNLKPDDLRKLGINRVTIGGKAMMASLSLLRKIGEELKGDDWDMLYADGVTYPEINNWF